MKNSMHFSNWPGRKSWVILGQFIGWGLMIGLMSGQLIGWVQITTTMRSLSGISRCRYGSFHLGIHSGIINFGALYDGQGVCGKRTKCLLSDVWLQEFCMGGGGRLQSKKGAQGPLRATQGHFGSLWTWQDLSHFLCGCGFGLSCLSL